MSHDGKTHDLPRHWDYHEIWTSVRDPAEWLASVWAHRERQAWRVYPHNVPWHYLCNLIAEHKDGRWNRFVRSITEKFPQENGQGLVEWFFNMMIPPPVVAYKLGPELYDKLRDLGGDPDAEGTQINAGDNVPTITDEHRDLIYKAEIRVYERFGFPAP